MRVAGLDLSLTATGVALPDGSTFTVRTNAKDGDRRLLQIVAALPVADLAVIEGMGRFPGNTGQIIAMVHGAVRTALMDAGVPYVIVSPATLKAYATGRGNADKAAMILAAYKRSGTEFTDDNQADAAWLRWAGLDHYGEPEFPVPQAQRAYLGKAVWP